MKSSFDKKDFELTKTEKLYDGVFQLVSYEFRYKLFNGEWSKLISREILERLSAVAVLPYDPKQDKIILIEQFRPGPLKTGKNPWFIEVVAGCIEGDETPENVAYREAIEEADCNIKRLHPMCDYFVSAGGSNEYIYLFCAEIDAPDNGGIYGLAEEDENIRAFVVSSDEAIEMLNSGQVKNATAIIALQWFQINREVIKKAWAETVSF